LQEIQSGFTLKTLLKAEEAPPIWYDERTKIYELRRNRMVQKFWRIRLGAARKRFYRFEKVFNLYKNEKPPCIAVGWGELELNPLVCPRIWKQN